VNSSHPNTTAAQTEHNWLELCKRLYPHLPVRSGSGRWAVATQLGIYLHETYTEASSSILDPRYARVVDLLTPAVPKIRDDYEDRQWEKRFGK
jgi:hypothetical protein